MAENLSAMRETQLQSLGQEDSPKKEMATSILAWEILWTEEPGGLQYMGSQRVGHDWATSPNTKEIQIKCQTDTLSYVFLPIR